LLWLWRRWWLLLLLLLLLEFSNLALEVEAALLLNEALPAHDEAKALG
jgi:hypothetical protein